MAHLFNLKPRSIKMLIFEFRTQHIGCLTDNLNIFYDSKIQNPIFYETIIIIALNKLLNVVDGIKHVLKPSSIVNSLSHKSIFYLHRQS